MNSTGIVRYIDDLGRIVIPKEIRQAMQIREGDPLEWYIDKSTGCLCLKKYAPLVNLHDSLCDYAAAVSRILDAPVIITDLDVILVAAGCSQTRLIDTRISDELKTLIDRRGEMVTDKVIPLTVDDSDGLIYNAQVIFPILAENEVFGSVVLLLDSFPDESEIKSVELMARMIGIQLEK